MRTRTLFKSIRAGKSIGNGTVQELVNWLEKFINISFPDNAIDYWSTDRYGSQNFLQVLEQVPSNGCSEECIHHVACYVREGRSEGYRIEVLLAFRDGTFKSLTAAKTFGKDDENWMIARVVTTVLQSILFDERIPEMVDMASRVPKDSSYDPESNLLDVITISSTQTAVKVFTGNNLILDDSDWSDEGNNSSYCVASRIHDWKIILTNMKKKFVETSDKILILEDLSGYVISDRGVTDITGFYVLPPGGNPKDDRTYLGYFNTAERAITAARNHRDAIQQST